MSKRESYFVFGWLFALTAEADKTGFWFWVGSVGALYYLVLLLLTYRKGADL